MTGDRQKMPTLLAVQHYCRNPALKARYRVNDPNPENIPTRGKLRRLGKTLVRKTSTAVA
jgi:hypothetical protein